MSMESKRIIDIMHAIGETSGNDTSSALTLLAEGMKVVLDLAHEVERIQEKLATDKLAKKPDASRVTELTRLYWLEVFRQWAEARLPAPQYDEAKSVLIGAGLKLPIDI